MKKIIKNIKPKNYDINYEYICPSCGYNHWLTSRETKTKGFRIACECGCILMPKIIKDIKIIYKKILPKNTQASISVDQSSGSKAEESIQLDKETLNDSVCILETYGFEKTEAIDLIKRAFEQTKNDNKIDLIKTALNLFGVSNASLVETN